MKVKTTTNSSFRSSKITILIAVAVLLVLFTAFVLPTSSQASPLYGFWMTTTSNSIGVAYWASGIPHYGAFFSGQNGYNQHFLGPGGDAITSCCSGGIGSWNWWGGSYNVLLLPKRWLFGGYSGSWTASNYQGTLYFN